MRTVVVTAPGKVELSFTWLPLFIGLDHQFKQTLEKELGPQLVGKDLTEEVLDWAHEQVVDAICKRYKIKGLRDYIDAIKFVEGPEE
jgi:hypothetical protein